jgi:hypothetical protein
MVNGLEVNAIQSFLCAVNYILVLQQSIFIVAVQVAHSNPLSSHNLDIREALRSRPREAFSRSGSTKSRNTAQEHEHEPRLTSQTSSFFSCFTIAKVGRDRRFRLGMMVNGVEQPALQVIVLVSKSTEQHAWRLDPLLAWNGGAAPHRGVVELTEDPFLTPRWGISRCMSLLLPGQCACWWGTCLW